MSLAFTPKVDYEPRDLCRTIEESPDDLMFFCDTSLFDNRTDARLWDALLNRDDKMVIVPPVHRELEPWLASHPTHPAARAILEQESSVHFLGLRPNDEREHTAAEYYINLLGFRKKLAMLEWSKFEDEHGRPPTDEEARQLMQRLHEKIGPRGYLLAKKGKETEGSPNFHTDETLVYLAMKTGIETGREVVILSKDEDLVEQFYKLQWLLDTHYRGMLLADAIASDPTRFPARPLPTDTPILAEMFTGDDNLLVERPQWLIMGDAAPILPPYCRPVIVHCWIVGHRFTDIAFCAEREMERLLHTKGVTRGLNTYKFGEKNCHLWLGPLNVPEPMKGSAAIAQDVRMRSGLVETPLFDANQAVIAGEQFMHAIET